ncbi:DNA-binding PucR family transcriptional regulator [Anoxybacillus vitaminiphilus]|uniref:DNA-binding PucR family transcriptional regulator n=1 Tax=Paranoxybacillus vitaminiphilus TaxID=581036 RepID=A0A327Y200_9BACL|nr:helix-turn-helix domain-containing protein [Anoxybacillus vitaminiphilus]RAK14086.1 DNA-binding PucR family transcriptional regulator [Anoxybacillus vitaminiphilus]
MELAKKEKLIKRIENHLRKTARQLVKFDTEEETLQYLISSFRSELDCDFVGIILKEREHIIPKVWSGESNIFVNHFPLKIVQCSPEFFNRSLTVQEMEGEPVCELTQLLNKSITTWFTVPLKDSRNSFGFCVIGFKNVVPLLIEMQKTFDDFGEDVAVAMALAKQKEAQKKKITGVEWITKNFILDSPIEQVVEKIVERAGKGTNARVACIYLYDEKENCFTFQPPSYGEMKRPKKIMIENNYMLKEYFPFLETTGGDQLTVPLVVNLKTIGVLHVEHKLNGTFENDDLEILELLSNYVAAMLENVRLYKHEKDHTKRLRFLLEYQQSLVKETIQHEEFDGITKTLSKLFSKSVILFDRFMRPISYELCQLNQDQLQEIVEHATIQVFQRKNKDLWFYLEDLKGTRIGIWPVNVGGDLLGYLAIEIPREEIDDFFRLSVDLALNIYSLQFIKRKLVLDAKEQVKDSFIHKLLVEEIEDEESIIQYANVFQWNLFHQHRVAVLKIELHELEEKETDILKLQSKKSLLWDQLKARLSIYDQNILFGNKGDEYILIIPATKEENNPKKYWSNLYGNIKKWLEIGKTSSQIFLGIGGKTETLQDYYTCYQQAVQALNVVFHSFREIGFALFDELGAYTVLHHLKDASIAETFIKKYLGPLIEYSEGKNMDLLQTLRVFLHCNGNLKDTSEELYIHRSTLQYRMEKIENLLGVNLDDSEHRFNLMMAFKLYDLYNATFIKKTKK